MDQISAKINQEKKKETDAARGLRTHLLGSDEGEELALGLLLVLG